MTTKRTLPDKPSELIKLAIEDMRSLDRTKYFPYYNDWHDANTTYGTSTADTKTNCRCCLAGAVMAGTLNLAIEATAHPRLYRFCPEQISTQEKLYAIDRARKHEWGNVFGRLKIDINSCTLQTLKDKMIESKYFRFRDWATADLFLADMEHNVKVLEEYGY